VKAEGYQKKEREEAAAKAEEDEKAAVEAARAAEDAADAKKVRLREKKAMQKERSRLRAFCTDIGTPHCLPNPASHLCYHNAAGHISSFGSWARGDGWVNFMVMEVVSAKRYWHNDTKGYLRGR